jgi:hypothetical protein
MPKVNTIEFISSSPFFGIRARIDGKPIDDATWWEIEDIISIYGDWRTITFKGGTKYLEYFKELQKKHLE